ncbi:MAG: ABC transporter substrate-binding protein [Acidimicrobiales bacterium]|nr:ABC transporter substrate-binding protein [Acidimicrobiales bacterium]
MRRSLARLLAVLVLFSILAAACGSDRDDETSSGDDTASTDDGSGDGTTADGTTADGETTDAAADGTTDGETTDGETTDGSTDEATDGTTSDAAIFGDDLAWPCSAGDASGATEQGVTDTTITIGVGDDRGFSGSPGLNKEQTDAILAFVDACNEMGGINGRTIEAVEYDAAIFNAQQVMTEACDQVFMLVGEGWSLDDQAEEIRVNCGLAAVPAWSVSAQFAHGPMMRQAVANPADQQAMSQPAQVAELFPDAIGNSGIMYANYPATEQTKDKVLASWPSLGYDFTVDLAYNISGEEDWTPFVRQLQDGGATHVYFTGSCLPNYQQLRQATALNEFDAIWTAEANFYETKCAEANADGAMDETYIRMAFIPFEEASANKATQDFLDVLGAAGADPSLLGAQAASSFMLWATAVQACGSDVTRQCVIDQIDAIDEWTTGGLHVPMTPRDNAMPNCGMLVKLEGTGYVRVAPEEPGTFACDDAWRQTIDTAAVQAVQLDENRVSTLYTAGG